MKVASTLERSAKSASTNTVQTTTDTFEYAVDNRPKRKYASDSPASNKRLRSKQLASQQQEPTKNSDTAAIHKTRPKELLSAEHINPRSFHMDLDDAENMLQYGHSGNGPGLIGGSSTETTASSGRVGPVRKTATKNKRRNSYPRTSLRNNDSASEPTPELHLNQKIDEYEANLKEIRKKEHKFIKADQIRRKKQREEQKAFMTWMDRVTLFPLSFWEDTWYNPTWIDEVASLEPMRMKRPSIVLFSPDGRVRGLFL